MLKSIPAVAVAVSLWAMPVGAQGVPPTTATDLSAADIQALVKSFPKDKTTDQLLRLADMGKYNVAVGAVSRAATASGGGALSHDKVTEVYYVLRGSGTQVSGGAMVGAKPTMIPVVGPSVSGSAIEGGRTTRLGPGDMQIIPPGVPHMWSAIDAGGVDYLVIRIDPDHVVTKK